MFQNSMMESFQAHLPSSIFPDSVSVGWTVKSKTSFNKVSPVTILGHSYLLNSEGKHSIVS